MYVQTLNHGAEACQTEAIHVFFSSLTSIGLINVTVPCLQDGSASTGAMSSFMYIYDYYWEGIFSYYFSHVIRLINVGKIFGCIKLIVVYIKKFKIRLMSTQRDLTIHFTISFIHTKVAFQIQ